MTFLSLASLLIFFFLSWNLVGHFRRYALDKGLMDIPNVRSSHQLSTPRGGGIVFVVLWLGAASLVWIGGALSSGAMFCFLPGAILVAAIGYGDDHYDLNPLWRALVHFIAALITVYFLLAMAPSYNGSKIFCCRWLEVLSFVFIIVWSINLFNFMDGIDGLAGMEACFIFLIGGWWLWQAGAQNYAYLAWVLVAAVAGFLVWNCPPARIFMGDGGSGFLGFLVASYALAGQIWLDIPFLLWMILYSVFWFDATVTLLRRILAGERWYTAHRSHAYQRLHQVGWSHHKILLVISVINALLMAAALWASTYQETIPWIFLAMLVLLCMAYWKVERLQPMYPQELQ
ncbi:MAG: MraY family glycosyltransferase [Candidatus Nitrosoglobus sp.]